MVKLFPKIQVALLLLSGACGDDTRSSVDGGMDAQVTAPDGGAQTGGDTGTGGDAETGGDTGTGGDAKTGGDAETGGSQATPDAGAPQDGGVDGMGELPPLPDGGWASIDTGLPNFPPRDTGSGSQSDLNNREAVVPPQCYTRTEGVHNPCYTCHQNIIEGIGHENRMADGVLQGDYGFSDTALTNRWRNLFTDRSAEVAAISDDEIRAYVDEDNYTALTPRLVASEFQGWVPDLWGLQEGALAFDAQGFAKDGSGWVAFNYKPLPSTFWPTNGSTDDVMIRLPEAFRTTDEGAESRDVYLANLAIVEAAIKNLTEVSCPAIDETAVNVDLDADGVLGTAEKVVRPSMYVGAASDVRVYTFLFPQGTSFLHTVRYLGFDAEGKTVPSRRMKEVRYMTKETFYRKSTLGAFYDEEAQEKIEGNLPRYADLKDKGIRNPFGWRVQGFIEDADGNLRPNSYEETFFCMGCHSTIGSTIDKTFSFARKVTGRDGWGYIDLHGMEDAPNVGETEGEILTYLRRVGGGAEFRNNPEMAERYFDSQGRVKADAVVGKDVFTLITPSETRALRLDKAYRAIVKAQSFVLGRDATVTPPENVFDAVDPNVVPLLPEHRHTWDIRLNWKE